MYGHILVCRDIKFRWYTYSVRRTLYVVYIYTILVVVVYSIDRVDGEVVSVVVVSVVVSVV